VTASWSSCSYPLVVVNDLDLIGIAISPFAANPPSIVDPDTVLPFPVARKLLESVARRQAQVRQ